MIETTEVNETRDLVQTTFSSSSIVVRPRTDGRRLEDKEYISLAS